MNSSAYPSWRKPHEDRRRITERRILGLGVLITLAFLGILARLWWLQIYLGDVYLSASEANRTRRVLIHAPRGAIVDRQNRPLADTRETLSLAVVPDFAKQNPELLGNLSGLLHVPLAELQAKVEEGTKNQFDPIMIQEDLDPDTLARVAENRVYLSGMVVQPSYRRYYPGDGKLATHLLGEIREVSPENLEELRKWGYRPGDLAGQSGVEKQYNYLLRGVDGGQDVEVNALGRMQRVLRQVQPHPGAKLTLSIDARVQAAAVQGLAGRAGAAVAINPQNGEVLAMASAPTFDNGIFSRKQDKKTMQQVLLDPNHPLLNRAIRGQPPGSTFKLISGSAVLQAHLVDTHYQVYCSGGLRIPGKFKKCWKHHGTVDFYGAIAQSCDAYFYRTGLMIGPRRIHDMAEGYGLGARTEVDLPNEKKGLVPEPDWFFRRTKEKWRPDHTASFVIGQGDLLATPLQMALATAAVGNGGTLYTPRVLLRASTWDGKTTFASKARIRRHVPVSPEVLAEVQRAVEMTVERGTGRVARIPGIRVAAKTGSAQFQTGKKTHGWFVCYAPCEKPTIAVAVLLESIGHGGENSGPIAHAMMEAWFGKQAQTEGVKR
jgi:penicillin-binding protein 2